MDVMKYYGQDEYFIETMKYYGQDEYFIETMKYYGKDECVGRVGGVGMRGREGGYGCCKVE